MADFAFHFDSVKKETPYTLKFEGCCTHSSNRSLIIKYNGPEVINSSTIVVHEDFLLQLKEEFNKQFGYGPFNLKKIKQNFEEKNSYYFNYIK